METNSKIEQILAAKFTRVEYIAAAMLETSDGGLARTVLVKDNAWRKAICWAIEAMRARQGMVRGSLAIEGADAETAGHTIHLQRHGDRIYAVVTLSGSPVCKSARRMVRSADKRIAAVIEAEAKAA